MIEPEKRELLMKEAGERSCAYKMQGYHCSEATIRACSEVLDIQLSEDLLRSACGFRGGGGGYGDRCGIIEAGCMLISFLYGRVSPYQDSWPYCYLIRVLHNRFEEEMGSIYCRDIMGREIARGCDPICLATYEKAAPIIVGLILDAPELLLDVPEEEKEI